MTATLERFVGFHESPYPWETWTSGESFEATKGYDFECTPQSFVMALRYQANRRRMRVKTSVSEYGHVRFQFLPRD